MKNIVNSQYNVIDWNTDRIIKSFNTLSAAKQYCKKLGHTGEDIEIYTGYLPVAYVGNDKLEVIYNPRFKKD